MLWRAASNGSDNMTTKINIAVGADGKGTTFEEIVKAIQDGRLNAKIVLLFSNKDNAIAIQNAKRWNIPVLVLDQEKSKAERDKILRDALEEHRPKIDLICLAGYLKLIPVALIQAFPKRIINSHPALDLERFGGKGMYGRHVAEAVIRAGLKETGSTIHFVTAIYDDPQGTIRQTAPIPIFPEDTPESLLSRQLPQEQELYIEVIKMFAESHLH